MKESIEIRSLDDKNIDDLIYVCSSAKLNDPVHRMGVEIKKKWLVRMLREYGPVAKIAYYHGRPVGQILYYPEAADPSSKPGSEGIIYLHCIYNPFPEAQRRGIGRRLLQALVDESRSISPILDRPCRYIVTHAFDTQEFLSQPLFYSKMGFKQVLGAGSGEMYLPVSGRDDEVIRLSTRPWWRSEEEYQMISEDKGRVVVFYSPVCQFSYPFSLKAVEFIKEAAPEMPVEMINSWEKPEEYLRRGGSWLIVNGKAVKAWLFDKDVFLREVSEALQA